MNSIPTFRKGRRKFKPGPRYSGPFAKITAFFLTMLLVVLPPAVLIAVEKARHTTYESLSDISNSDIVELADLKRVNNHMNIHVADQDPLGNGIGTSVSVVHGTSSDITSSVHDMGMGIKIENALRLSRHTEYCQWQEIKRESCNTCTRTKTIENEDGSTSTQTETYDCDCTIEYDYIKSWRPYRVNSYLFDQPAAHYNPQNDPMPSAVFASKDATMKFQDFPTTENTTTFGTGKSIGAGIDISSEFFESIIRGLRSRPVKWVRGGIPKIPPFWLRWIPDRSRYENIAALNVRLSQNQNLALGERADEFIYVGDGYFFLPHEASVMERLFKAFGEYVEGTLLDWQLGDIMPSCTAGDIRIHYSVQDPDTVSILGQLHEDRTIHGSSDMKHLTIQPFQATNGKRVALVHEGSIDALSMISKEEWNSFLHASMFRILLIFWALAMSRLLGSIFGMVITRAKKRTQVAFAFCIWSFLMGIVWSYVWGPSTHAVVLIVSSLLFGIFILYNPPPHLKKAPGLKAGWYKFSHWADGMGLKED